MPKGRTLDDATRAKIKALAKDMTQAQIAYRFGISTRTVEKVLEGK